MNPAPSAEPQYAASALQSQYRFIQSLLGDDGMRRALARLSATDRDTLESLTSVGWYPLALSEQLMRAGADESGREYSSFHDEVVRGVISQNYKTIWRALLALTTDAALVARASTMVHKAFDRGEVSAKIVAPGRCEMVIACWPDMPDRAVNGIRVAMQTVLELSRRRGVAVTAQRLPDGVRYDARWNV